MAEEIQTGPMAALGIAYEAVMKLGYKHQRLVNENAEVNHNTLRRIRDRQLMKSSTIEFYLHLFLSLLMNEYRRRMKEGGEGASRILLDVAKISCAEHGVDSKRAHAYGCKDDGGFLR